MFNGNTESNITAVYQDGDGTIDLSADNDHVRTVTAGGNTLATSETLAFTAGSNVTISESGGAVTIAAANDNTQLSTEQVQDIVGAMFSSNTETRITASYQDGDGTIDLVVDDLNTDTNTNQLTTFQLEDGDGTEVTVAHGKEVKFVEGGGIDINWTDTSTGSDGDPYDLTFTASGISDSHIASDAVIAISKLAESQITIDGTAVSLGGSITTNNTQLSTENVQDIVGAMFSSNTETRVSATYQDGDGTIDLVVDDMTANDNTNQLTTFQLEDGDGTEVTVSHAKEVKFVEGGRIDINWTDTSNGSNADPYDLTFTVDDDLSNYDNSSSGFLTAHPNISAASTSNNSGRTYIQDITLDSNGHVTGITTATETVTNTDTNTQLSTEQVQDIVGAMFSSNTETRISATYQDSDGTIDLAVDDMTANDNTQLSDEQVQDIVGAMFSSNTETRISATYQDGDGTIDLVVDDFVAAGDTVDFNNVTCDQIGVNVSANGTNGRIDAGNDIVAFSSSDKRLKENIKPLDNALDKVSKINGVEFDWKPLTEEEKKTIHGNEGHDVGVIAQEIEEVLPEVVQTRDTGYKAVKYEKLVPLLIEAIKELKEEVEELKK